MALSFYLLLVTIATVFGCANPDYNGQYNIILSGSQAAGVATITNGQDMFLDLGGLGTSGGTFSTSGSTGTAVLSGGTLTMKGADGTHTGPFSWNDACTSLTISVPAGPGGTIELAKMLPLPPPSPPGDEPCFPSSSTVTLANGAVCRIDALKEGDRVVAATAGGAMTIDTVSFLSIAKPEAEASFITLTTEAATLTLTPEHHLPVGAACCSELKKAKDVAVGEVVWTRQADSVAPQAVLATGLAIERGLHSPVLTGGSFPVVDGVVTSFDSIEGVTLAKVGLQYLTTLCQATGTCRLLRSALISAEPKYVDEAQPVLAPPLLAGELEK